LRQKSSIIALYITPEIGPSIAQITEAGIIGKIGFNSCGVGTCLNAIRAKGVSFNKLPLHLAVRAALNSLSAASAVAVLEKVGVACSGHILIADANGGIGTEWSILGSQKIQPKDGVVAHTNHFLCPQPEGVAEPRVAPDSFLRMDRVMELVGRARDKDDGKGLTVESIEEILDDEQGFPCSINRMAVDGESQMTLFSIAMDLKSREARVRIGRPTEGGQKLTLKATSLRDYLGQKMM
jgi:isopenicillin-N N-acyltransferase like protein